MTSLSSVKADTGNNIAINYSTYETTQLGVKHAEYNAYEYPYSGFTYLIVNMTIENNGYSDFSTDPQYFYVIANNTKYTYSVSETSSLNIDLYNYGPRHFHIWKNVDVQNGGTFAGTIVFLIPEGSIISMGYSGNNSQSQSFNIVWTSVTPSPTPSPEPTPSPTDTHPPKISIEPPKQQVFTSTDVTLYFTINEQVNKTAYSLDGMENVTISENLSSSGSTTLGNLAYGSHNVSVYAWDMAGNVGRNVVKFEVVVPYSIITLIVLAIVLPIAVGLYIYFRKRINESREKEAKSKLNYYF
jgi:hypothetical protein